MMIVPKSDLDELWLRAEAIRLSVSLALTCLSDHDADAARAELERMLLCRLPDLQAALEAAGAEHTLRDFDEPASFVATIADH